MFQNIIKISTHIECQEFKKVNNILTHQHNTSNKMKQENRRLGKKKLIQFLLQKSIKYGKQRETEKKQLIHTSTSENSLTRKPVIIFNFSIKMTICLPLVCIIKLGLMEDKN